MGTTFIKPKIKPIDCRIKRGANSESDQDGTIPKMIARKVRSLAEEYVARKL